MQRLVAEARSGRRRSVAGVVATAAAMVPLLVLCAGCGWLGGEAAEEGWWDGLETEAKVFFGIAFVFSALFLWQFIMTLVGLAGGGAEAEVGAGEADVHFDAEAGEADAGAMDADVGDAHVGVEVGGDVDLADADVHAIEVSEAETTISFKLLSLRSVITGGMLFGWAGALYVQEGVALGTAMLLAMAWAAAGAIVVAALMYGMRRMQETGNRRLSTCVGQAGSVYMDIPKSGTGKVRTVVSGAVAFVPARTADGKPLKAGTPVRVLRLLDPSTVEVEAVKE